MHCFCFERLYLSPPGSKKKAKQAMVNDVCLSFFFLNSRCRACFTVLQRGIDPSLLWIRTTSAFLIERALMKLINLFQGEMGVTGFAGSPGLTVRKKINRKQDSVMMWVFSGGDRPTG